MCSFILLDLCEQPKPSKQLPILGSFACIPVNANLTVSFPVEFTDSQAQTIMSQAIQAAMATGALNTPNEVVGLVYSSKPSSTVNKSGVIEKHMRPLGIGLLSAGCVVVFLSILAFIVCRCRRQKNADNSKHSFEDEDDDLSLEKDKDDEESNVLTVSYMSDDSPVQSPNTRK